VTAVYITVGIFMAFCFIMSIVRLRREGPGPAVNYVPKALRPTVNAYYRSCGWQEPLTWRGTGTRCETSSDLHLPARRPWTFSLPSRGIAVYEGH
jgi:hypothetical protein